MNGRPWSAAELAILRDRYADTPTAALAGEIGRPACSLYQKARALGLKNSEEYLNSPHACRLRRGDNVGAPYRFKPGHVPANKGLRRPGWHAGTMQATQFKKGQKPQTWVPVGTESVDADGYLKRKIRDDAPRGFSRYNWRYVHVLLWETQHGPVPKGYAVGFINGDKADLRPDNLVLLSRTDLMRRNTLHNYPKEIALAIQLRGALIRKINRRTRNEKQHG